MAEVEKIEKDQALNNVAEADKKIADIKAEKAAKKAAKHQETLEKHPKAGRFFNWVDDNKGKLLAGAATGGAGFVLGMLYERCIRNKASGDIEPEIPETEATVEPPFDTEA